MPRGFCSMRLWVLLLSSHSCIGKDLLFDLGKYIFPKPILWSTLNLNLKLGLFLYVVFKLLLVHIYFGQS
ncbi:hypothetical protein VNO80_22646 [Phaseolus coccineus]|uniref:Uncharacterized protein n=1 Tax=Phaseolus coccineus TaxID=3886 RepID=A0AAN9MA30_PHACN